MTPPGPLSIESLVHRVSHWLPTQGPIKEFVHHNTLHAFQEYEFFEGCLRASRLYGSRAFLPMSEYRQLAREGRISQACLARIARRESAEEKAAQRLMERLMYGEGPDETLPSGLVENGIRGRWKSRGVNLNLKTHPILFRLTGQYLDQGISMWRMPHAQYGLFAAVGQIVRESWLPLEPYSRKSVRGYFEQESGEVVLQILQRFVGREEFFERYLLEMSLAHPGWSGMVSMIENEPHSLVLHRRVTLLDFCALELLAELAYVEAALGKDFEPLVGADEPLSPLPCSSHYNLEWNETERLQRIWQEAFEASYANQLLGKLARRDFAPAAAAEAADVQAFFCIDDRECSLRRHLEEVHPSLKTYGFAGFFGIDCLFQGVEDAFPFKHCPVPVTPQHLIREIRKQKKQRKARLPHESDADSHTLLRGFLISQTLGFWSAFKLAISLFRPTMSPLTASSLRRVDVEAELQVERKESEAACDGLHVGYSETEMADRVGNILRATGAVSDGLAPLVVFFGHGASSVNNPYFAAYDCGACSGKAGAPNARAFALMANRPGVRAILAKRGVAIPETTWFVGALHDTTRDEVQFYDLESLPRPLLPVLDRFRKDLEVALQRNAKERCQKFALVSPQISEKTAHMEVCRRSISIFEPRPELNHATNAACIVARRSLTRGLNLDRRSFLNSYDPEIDPQGETLSSILNAVVPVCGGINLEYYFSRLDPKVYGAGSKLPHNVNGLIGVMNGVEGDLLTGLPTQMTEVHDPLRLLMVVEQTAAVALLAVRRNPAVYEWVKNSWIQYVSVDPKNRQISYYQSGAMHPWSVWEGESP